MATGHVDSKTKPDLMTRVNKNIVYHVDKDVTNNVAKGGSKGGSFSETKS